MALLQHLRTRACGLSCDAAELQSSARRARGPDVGNNATVKLQRKMVAGGKDFTAFVLRRSRFCEPFNRRGQRLLAAPADACLLRFSGGHRWITPVGVWGRGGVAADPWRVYEVKHNTGGKCFSCDDNKEGAELDRHGGGLRGPRRSGQEGQRDRGGVEAKVAKAKLR